jgi:hypothetical protein
MEEEIETSLFSAKVDDGTSSRRTRCKHRTNLP